MMTQPHAGTALIQRCFVTGATSPIGRHIVDMLLGQGRKVRILSRGQLTAWHPALEVVQGDLRDQATLGGCIKGVDAVFHCAAEFHNSATLWDVNVGVTRALVERMRHQGIAYFCHISSAGVLGACSDSWVDESTPCHPRDLYERSKYAAEQCVMTSQLSAKVCVLRPVFVVSRERLGFVCYAMRNGWRDRLMVLFKGNEQAHLVHASDVASAAVFFMDRAFTGGSWHQPECFYVACDEDAMNTVGGIYACYRHGLEYGVWNENPAPPFALPRWLPHWVRTLRRGPGLHGRVRFSSAKLKQFGFVLPMGFRGALRDIIEAQKP
ncbi:MAG: NAD-dependent epimerase/dehydratase family protein [Mariprofundales bacterium]